MKPEACYLLNFIRTQFVSFVIPPYQRNYEWEEDQCKFLLEDIIKTAEERETGEKVDHFFGTLIFYMKEGSGFLGSKKLILTDGQQRITSAMLFIAAVRDLLSERDIQGREYKSVQELKKIYNDSFLFNRETSAAEPRLIQIEKDKDVYLQIIRGDGVKNRESNLYKNYQYFKTKLQEYSNKNPDKSLADLVENGLAGFQIVAIELDPERNSWENPQDIFESMNSLGKPLSLGDLVRNYLLIGKSIPEQEEIYSRYWVKIEETLPDSVSDFIRDYMQMIGQRDYKKSTDSNTKELYRDFKKLFQGSDTTDLMKKLVEAAYVYASIVDPIGNSTGSSQIDRLLTDFHHIKATTVHSLLLEALLMWKRGEVTEEALAEVLDVLRIFFLRRRTVKLNNAENKALPQMAYKLPDFLNSQDPRKTTFEYLQNNASRMRLPSDMEITEVLKNDNFYSLGISKLLLVLMEEKLTKYYIPLNDKNLQKEHILPQTLNADWKKELGPEAENIRNQLTDNIGNITLIRHNQELGNKTFALKKETFKENSGLQIARTKIIEHEHWGEKEILERRNWMIQFLLDQVMPVPETIVLTNQSKSTRKKPVIDLERLGLIGKEITSTYVPELKVKVVDGKHVEFEGKKWSLSGLVRELKTRRGECSGSGAYQGPRFWTYNGVLLSDLNEQSLLKEND